MKTMTLCCIAVMAAVVQVFAQSPTSFSYQLVARDSSGNLMTNREVSFRISILADSIGGTARYVETQSRITNSFGLTVLQVGRGAVKSGSMQAIDWGSTGHFIRTEMDPEGNTNYILMGTTELLSVPYALYAGKASPSNVAGTGIAVSGDTIRNTAPDQVVTLEGGTGISVLGTYPGFTVYNDQPDIPVNLNAGTGIQINGNYPDYDIINSEPDQIVVLTPGMGINVNGTYPSFQIKNMAPDQTVVLNNGTGISVGGSYPNFTITNISPDQTVALAAGTGISISGTYPNFTVTNSQPNAPHTGDATGSSALSVVRLQGRTLSANAPATNQVLKWNGSSWIPMTDETRDGCPAGFTSVNSEYCIETAMHDWTMRSWFNTITACGNITGGAHLCNWADWYNACSRAGTLGLSHMTGYWMWVDDGLTTSNYARVAGNTSCTDRDNKDIDTAAAYTRCCFNK